MDMRLFGLTRVHKNHTVWSKKMAQVEKILANTNTFPIIDKNGKKKLVDQEEDKFFSNRIILALLGIVGVIISLIILINQKVYNHDNQIVKQMEKFNKHCKHLDASSPVKTWEVCLNIAYSLKDAQVLLDDDNAAQAIILRAINKQHTITVEQIQDAINIAKKKPQDVTEEEKKLFAAFLATGVNDILKLKIPSPENKPKVENEKNKILKDIKIEKPPKIDPIASEKGVNKVEEEIKEIKKDDDDESDKESEKYIYSGPTYNNPLLEALLEQKLTPDSNDKFNKSPVFNEKKKKKPAYTYSDEDEDMDTDMNMDGFKKYMKWGDENEEDDGDGLFGKYGSWMNKYVNYGGSFSGKSYYPEEPEDLSKPNGLVNPSVYCYINSILQFFASILNSLNYDEALQSELAATDNSTKTFSNFIKFLEEIRKGYTGTCLNVGTTLYKEFSIQNKGLFPVYSRQGDSQEVFSFLYNLSENENWKKNFLLSLIRTNTCKNHHTWTKNEPVSPLQLTFPPSDDPIALDQLIEFNQEPEEIVVDCNNKRCPLLKATSTFKIVSLPNVLVLHLKRFRQTHETKKVGGLFATKSESIFTNKTEKIYTPVIIPQTLELIDESYELNSISFHSGGSLNSGHYTSLVRFNDKWWYANDRSVTESSLDIIKKGNYITGGSVFTPYLIFFTKIKK